MNYYFKYINRYYDYCHMIFNIIDCSVIYICILSKLIFLRLQACGWAGSHALFPCTSICTAFAPNLHLHIWVSFPEFSIACACMYVYFILYVVWIFLKNPHMKQKSTFSEFLGADFFKRSSSHIFYCIIFPFPEHCVNFLQILDAQSDTRLHFIW